MCIFASSLSTESSLRRVLPPLLERVPRAHSADGRCILLLPSPMPRLLKSV